MDPTSRSPAQTLRRAGAARPTTDVVLGWSARLFAPAPAFVLRARDLLLALAALGLGAAVVLGRQPGAGALNTVWAEDGNIFLSDATNRSPLDALTTSYAGYYHLIPRLLAELAALTPAGAAAEVLAVEAALCTAVFALLVYIASAGQLASRWSRVLVAAVVVVLPLGQDDLPNAIANLHWPALYVLFWMLLWTPSSRPGRTVAPLVVLFIAASDILVAALLPLACLRLLVRRDRYSVLLASAFIAGWAVQVVGLLTGSASRALALNPFRWLTGYVVRVVPQTMLGERWFGGAVDARWLALAAAAWLVLTALVLASLRLVRSNMVLALVAAVQSVLLYALPVFLSGNATPRYAAAPAMLVVTALVALATPRGEEAVHGARPSVDTRAERGWVRAVPLGVLTVLLCITWAVNYRLDNRRADGPGWREQIAVARATCATEHPATVEVPIPPAKPTAWSARLPCRYVRH